MFSRTIQPPLISLFSSTSSHPLLLASASTSDSLTTDSFISLLSDATDSNESLFLWHGTPGSSRELKGKGKEVPRGNLRSRVLHLQSPDIRSTKVVFGSSEGLGIQLPYLHFALKDLGQLFYLEVDLGDYNGALLRLRLSSFQNEPRAHPSHSPPLLHLPLRFPPPSPHALTPWSILSLPLPHLLAAYSSAPCTDPQARQRFGRFKSLERVAVHANVRLRRVWCTEEAAAAVVGEGMALRGMRTELALFAAVEE